MPLEMNSKGYGGTDHCKCECHNVDLNTFMHHLVECCTYCEKCQYKIVGDFDEHKIKCKGTYTDKDIKMEDIIRLNQERR